MNFKEYIVRVPVTVIPSDGVVSDTDITVVGQPDGTFYTTEIGERYGDHAIIVARISKDINSNIGDFDHWLTADDFLKLATDTAHLHGITSPSAFALHSTYVLADYKVSKEAQLRQQSTDFINATWPTYKQINAALGVYGDKQKTACAAFITGVRDKVNAAIADLRTKETVTEASHITLQLTEK